MRELTKRQKEVLSFVANYQKKHSYPPTIREVADHFKISVKGAHDHITALNKKGHLKFAEKRPRTMELTHSLNDNESDLIEIPILGKIAAGTPILAEENYTGSVKLPRLMVKKNKDYFILMVSGDSMTGAGILEGDMAIIERQESARNGDIVVATTSERERANLKRFYKESSRIRLQSESDNPVHKPTYSRNVKILGRLFCIIRNY